MTESTKLQPGIDPSKLYCREPDLERVAQEGEGTVYMVNGSRPFPDWVEVIRRPVAQPAAQPAGAQGTTIAHQAGVIPEGVSEAEYWRDQAAKSAARVLVLKRQVTSLQEQLAAAPGATPALTLEQLQDRAADFKRVLMPMHLTREMMEVISESEWKWEDLLAAAAAITEPQYEEIASGGPALDALKDLLLEWGETYVAFEGAFDTPHMRLQINDEYANDARARLRGFDESLAALAANTKQADDARKLVNGYCNDLLDCAAVLYDDGRFKDQALEIRRAVVDVRAACKIGPAVADIESAPSTGADVEVASDPLSEKAYMEDQGQKEQLNSIKD